MFPATRYFFVYRVLDNEPLDERVPIGGLTAQGWTELAIIEKGFLEAYRRFPCKPSELLVVLEVQSMTKRRQAVLMERDWERAFRSFEQLMTVS